MDYKFNHFNFNVKNLDESIKFYNEALGLREIRRKEASDGSFTIAFLGDGSGTFSLELTCLKENLIPPSPPTTTRPLSKSTGRRTVSAT